MSLDDRTRRLIGQVALGVAGLSTIWAVHLWVFGGFDVTVLGARIRSNDPFRPTVLAAISTVVMMWAFGPDRSVQVLRAIRRLVGDRPVAAVLVAGTLGVGWYWGTQAAGGSDSYGYLSEVDLWLNGLPVISQPWVAEVPWPNGPETFAPLGYKTVDGQAAIVATYPSGLPIVMAGAKAVGGACAIFWVVPVFGALMIAATYGIGRRLGSSAMGLIAAWLVATSPAFLYMLVAPVTDVAAASCWAIAFYLLLGRGSPSAFGAGLAGGLAVFIRPNFAPMAGLLVVWYAFLAWRDAGVARAIRIRQTLAVIAGLLPAAATIAAINTALYGSPFRLGYAKASDYYAWSHVAHNVRTYFLWLADSQTTIAVAGLAVLFVPIRRLWPTVPNRWFIGFAALFVFCTWAQYCFFLDFDAWWYLRMLLACWPFIMLGVATLAVVAMRLGKPVVTIATLVVLAMLGIRDGRVASDRGAFDTWTGEQKYVIPAERLRAMTSENAVVVAMQHSGSVRYYSGRVTLRYDALDKAWLDRAVAWMAEHDVHAYALLDDWELPVIRQQFAGQQTLSRLKTPLFTFENKVFFYDLTPADGPAPKTEFLAESRVHARCVPPAAMGRLVFK